MTEVVLTRLRDFSCKNSTFNDCKTAGQSACSPGRTECLNDGCKAAEGGRKLDIESALAWLRRELVRLTLWWNFCTGDNKARKLLVVTRGQK